MLTPDVESNPTKRWLEVATRRVMALLLLELNCVSRVSPDEFGATRVQSPGSHCCGSVPFEGSHDQSCGPVVVFRAAKRCAPNATIAGTARWAGSRDPRTEASTVTEVLAPQAGAEGVAFDQFAHPLETQGAGAPTERA